jgi:hypothetical protein
MGRARNGKTDLETTREALASWRRQYGGRGRRIPEQFWNQARELACVHGMGETARALRLNPGRLEAVVGRAPAAAPTSVEPNDFVEVSGLQLDERSGAAVVEFLGREGECVRVQIAASAVDIAALAAAFWSRRP